MINKNEAELSWPGLLVEPKGSVLSSRKGRVEREGFVSLRFTNKRQERSSFIHSVIHK
jgi:hypothetical protein